MRVLNSTLVNSKRAHPYLLAAYVWYGKSDANRICCEAIVSAHLATGSAGCYLPVLTDTLKIGCQIVVVPDGDYSALRNTCGYRLY